MRTSSPSSKKCSTDNFRLAIRGRRLLSGAVVAALFLAVPAFPSTNLRSQLLSEIHHNGSGSFDKLLSQWQLRYGTDVVPTLLGLARDRHASDPDRYVALMASAKIGGSEAAPLLSPLLKDPSWMIRDGTLRALAALNRRDTAALVLPLLRDSALVVRLEAIQSVEKLKPEGAPEALLAMVSDSANYHHGKAQWVPQRALEALLHLKTLRAMSMGESHSVALRLSALLDNSGSPVLGDPGLKAQIAETARVLAAAD